MCICVSVVYLLICFSYYWLNWYCIVGVCCLVMIVVLLAFAFVFLVFWLGVYYGYIVVWMMFCNSVDYCGFLWCLLKFVYYLVFAWFGFFTFRFGLLFDLGWLVVDFLLDYWAGIVFRILVLFKVVFFVGENVLFVVIVWLI